MHHYFFYIFLFFIFLYSQEQQDSSLEEMLSEESFKKTKMLRPQTRENLSLGIILLVRDRNAEKIIRCQALIALAQFGESAWRTIPDLQQIINDESEDQEIKKYARFALDHIGEGYDPLTLKSKIEKEIEQIERDFSITIKYDLFDNTIDFIFVKSSYS